MNDLAMDGLKGLSFAELFDLNELQGIQDLFSDTMGLASVITGPDGVPLTRPSHESDFCRDLVRPSVGGKLYCAVFAQQIQENLPDIRVFPCLDGAVLEAVCSIAVQDHILAYWRIGQVRNPEFNAQRLTDLARRIGVEETLLRKAWEALPAVAEDHLSRIAGMVKRIIGAFSTKAFANLQLKAALEETAHLEERWKYALEGASDGVWDWNVPEGTVFYSSNWKKMLGYTDEEIGNSLEEWSSRVHPDDWPVVEEVIRQHLREETPMYRNEHRLRCRDGSYKWILDEGKVVRRDESGKPLRAIGTHKDITSRRNAEEALRISERKFAGAFQTSPYPILITRISDGKIVEVNQSFFEFSGYSPEETYSSTTLSLDLWAFPEQRELLIADLVSGIGVRNREYSFKIRSGEIITCLYSAAILNIEGEAHVLSGIENITEQRKNEQRLRESEALFESIMMASPDNISITDMNGIVIRSSQISLSMFRYTSMDQVIGRPLSDFIHPGDVQKAYENIGKMINGIHEGPGEYRGLRSDGTVFDIEVNGEFIYDDHGNMDKMVFVVRDISERKAAEEKLRQSEETFRKLVESINDVIYEISPEGILKYVSPSSTRVLGYTPEEVIGTCLLDYIVEEDRPVIFQALKDIQHREYTYLEYRYYTRDGQVRWVRSSTTALVKDGVLVGGTGSLTEITEKKLVELELNKLSRAVEQSPVSIVITNLDGNIEYANPKACETTGYHLEELLGKNPRVLKSGETQAEEYAGLWQDITNGKSWKGIFHNKRKNGDLYWESSTISPIMDPEGNILHYLAVKEDITEKIRIERALASSENRLKQIAQQSQTIIWEVDMNGLYRYISPVVTEILGYKPEEVIGKMHFYDFHPEKGREEFRALALELMSTGGEFKEYENQVATKDGKSLWVSTNGAPLFDREGRLKGYIGSDNDITERKQNLVTLSEHNERLHALVNAMPDMLFVMDSEGMYTECYAADSDKLLIDLDRVVGTSIQDIYDEENARMHLSRLSECLDQQRLITYEYKVGEGSGQSYYEARLTPMGSSKILALIRDITESKHQELELRKLSLAIEQSPVIVVITDLQARIEYVNPAFEVTTGYRKDEILGMPASLLQSGQTAREVYLDLWATIRAGKEWHGEWLNRKKNGDLYWESISITPIHDGSGKINSFLGVKQDISERKRNEAEILELNQNLEEKVKDRTNELARINDSLRTEIEERIRIDKALTISEKKYRHVVENVTEVIFQTDIKGNWLFLNNAWETVTGFSVEQSLGQNFLGYVHPDDREQNLMHFIPLINKEKDFCKHQVRYLTRDGGFRWIEVFARLGAEDDENSGGTFGTLVDITERRHKEDFERELLHLSSKLTGIRLKEIPEAINYAMREIGNYLEADRSYIFEFDDDGIYMNNTYEWCRDGIEPQIDNLKEIPIDIIPRWMDILDRDENVIIPSVEDLPESCIVEKEILLLQGIKSLIAIPFMSNQKLIGFVGLDSVRYHRNFTESEINNLRVWSNMLASLIKFSRSEKLLEQTRWNYETFFNTIDDFLFVINEAGNIIHINDTVKQRLGYTPEELIGKPVLQVHPEDRQEEASHIVQEMILGIQEFCPVPLVTKSGDLISVETRVKKGYWDGKPAIFGVSKDVSKIKLSEEKFSKAFQSNSSIMMITSVPDLRLIDINEAFEKSFGYKRGEALGKSPADLNLVVDCEDWERKQAILFEQHYLKEAEILFRSKTSEIRTGLISADTIVINDQLCVLAVIVDYTERKKAEEESLKARNEAEKANLAKSEFLSRMSHELRTPLNSILGFAQLMEMGEISAAHRKGVHHILTSGKHLLNLINEVLDIARIEAGRLSLSLEPVPLNVVISEMIDVVAPNVSQMRQKLDFTNQISSDWYVNADRQRLKQVLLNLINNAIKYTGAEGEIGIKTSLLPAQKEDNITWCRISVIDNGPGIGSDDLNKLFTPFERIGAERTTTEGTGLGLPIVKKLMDAMGGKVSVESEPGKGSVFSIDLPMVSRAQHLSLIQPDTDNDDQGIQAYYGTVLYVEDNLPNVELVEDILQAHRPGIRMITTVYGEMAQRYAEENSPGLILLDLDLPDVNGAEVLQQLRSKPSTRSIPVVIISANAMPYQIKKLMEGGAEMYLTKPLEIKNFLQVLDRYLTKVN